MGDVEGTKVLGSIPASRTNQPFPDVPRRSKTRMPIGIAGFLVASRGFGKFHEVPSKRRYL